MLRARALVVAESALKCKVGEVWAAFLQQQVSNRKPSLVMRKKSATTSSSHSDPHCFTEIVFAIFTAGVVLSEQEWEQIDWIITLIPSPVKPPKQSTRQVDSGLIMQPWSTPRVGS